MNNNPHNCRILKLLIVHAAFLLLIPSSLHAWQGTVVKVIDGDTIEVQRKGSIERIRLYGIDAPEKDQPFGRRIAVLTSTVCSAGKRSLTALCTVSGQVPCSGA